MSNEATSFAVEHVQSIDSTNAELLRRAATHSIHGRALVADQQTAGRGQRGRRWQSHPGQSLMVSIGIEFAKDQRLEGLSLAIGVAVADAAKAFTQRNISLKWPNDVLIDDSAKIGGILVETVSVRGKLSAVIGVGINLLAPRLEQGEHATPGELRALSAGGLLDQRLAITENTAEDSVVLIRNAILNKLLSNFSIIINKFILFGFPQIKQSWWSYCAFLNQRVEIVQLEPDRTRGPTLVGRIHGIDDTGALILDDGRALHTLRSGNISLRPLAP